MARKDIIVNTEYSDIMLSRPGATKWIANMSLLEAQAWMDNDHFCYAEVAFPMFRGLSYQQGDTILVRGAYHAVEKPIKVRFLLDNENQSEKEYLTNKYDNTVWFNVQTPDNKDINFCELVMVNPDSLFELVFTNNGLHLYSGYETDMRIGSALTQNKNLLLLSRMGSLYQYPLTGVGLVEYLNSNMQNARLAEKLQSEFLNDGMVVIDATIDSETGELDLIVEE